MNKIIILVYVILSALIALLTTIFETQPALYLINLSAPNPGDSYSLTLVYLITWLIFLSPLVIIMLVSKAIRDKSEAIEIIDRTGVYITREKSFQSSLVPIPVFINSRKVGVVDNGKTKFFGLAPGKFSLKVGKGKQTSNIVTGTITKDEELTFNFKLEADGLFTKIILEKDVLE